MSARPRRGGAWRADQAGATAVETAILLPVLVVFLLGILELGWAFHCASTVRWAVERGARTFLLKPDATEAEVRADVLTRVAGVVAPANLALTFAEEESEPGRRMARVSSAYRHQLVIPFVPAETLQFRSQTLVPIATP